MDHFHLPLDTIWALTPWQVDMIYLHPRDEHGTIVVPKGRGRTRPADVLSQLLRAKAMFQLLGGATPEQHAELDRRIAAETERTGGTRERPDRPTD